MPKLKPRKKKTLPKIIEIPTDDAQFFLNKINKYLELAIKGAILDTISGEEYDIAMGQLYGCLNVAKIINAKNLKITIDFKDLDKSSRHFKINIGREPPKDSEQGDSGDPKVS